MGTAVTVAARVRVATDPGPDEDQVVGNVLSIVDNKSDQLVNIIIATGQAELQHVHTANANYAQSEVPSILSSMPSSEPSSL
eukprot:2308996-Ditylum_brightwellii.AAC.1